VCVCMHDKSLD